MTIPPESRLIILLLALALFGIGYNKLVEYGEKKCWMNGHVSYAVVIGVSVTIAAEALALWTCNLPGWAWMVVTLGAFTCSGSPMIIGSRARHALEIQQAKDRKNHKAMLWPHVMSDLRNLSAEEAMHIYHILSTLQGLYPEHDSVISKARESAIKIAAFLKQAGAPMDLRNL
jgi:hypothetical protein